MGGSRIYVMQTGLTLNGTTEKAKLSAVEAALKVRAEVARLKPCPHETQSRFLSSFGMTDIGVCHHGLVLVGDGQPDVNGREHRENIGLNYRDEDVQSHKQDGDDHGKDAKNEAENGALGPCPFEGT